MSYNAVLEVNENDFYLLEQSEILVVVDKESREAVTYIKLNDIEDERH